MPLAIVLPGHARLEQAFQVPPELGYRITDTLFPKAWPAGLSTLANTGPDVITEPVFGLKVIIYFGYLLLEDSQAGLAEPDGL